MVRIKVSIVAGEGMENYRQQLLKLQRTLRRLEVESPFRFEIIGYPNAGKISQIPRVSRKSVVEILRESHLNTAPAAYSPKLAGGNPFRRRVDAALPMVQSLRDQAIKEYEGEKPKPITRSQAQLEWAIAHNLFGPNIIKR